MVELSNLELNEYEKAIFNVIKFEGAVIEFDEKPYAILMFSIFLF